MTTEIGYFVNRVWVTEGIAPGRRRLLAPPRAAGACTTGEGSRWATARVRPERAPADGGCLLRQVEGVGPFESADPDSQPHLVERRRRAPEPDVPGAARPGHGHALLAPEGRGGAGAGRATATATCSSTRSTSMEVYREWLALAASGARARRAAPAALARPPAAAGRGDVPGDLGPSDEPASARGWDGGRRRRGLAHGGGGGIRPPTRPRRRWHARRRTAALGRAVADLTDRPPADATTAAGAIERPPGSRAATSPAAGSFPVAVTPARPCSDAAIVASTQRATCLGARSVRSHMRKHTPCSTRAHARMADFTPDTRAARSAVPHRGAVGSHTPAGRRHRAAVRQVQRERGAADAEGRALAGCC